MNRSAETTPERVEEGEWRTAARLVRKALGPAQNGSCRVLDLGCGAGRLLNELNALGLDAFGCDLDCYIPDELPALQERFSPISTEPYRLPYPDGFFQAVVSTTVLEHAQNSEELLGEVKRVLKPGGLSMHILPGKWYLPTEPHIFVPLVSWMWPRVPRWWLALWAHLGVRSEAQRGLSPAEVTEQNLRYAKNELCYRSTRAWSRISLRIFGNVEWPMDFLLANVDGGVAKAWRRLPCKRLIQLLSRETRMALMVHRKAPATGGGGATSLPRR